MCHAGNNGGQALNVTLKIMSRADAKKIIFHLKKGNVMVSGYRKQFLMRAVEKIVKNNPKITDFGSIKEKVEGTLVACKKLNEQFIVQITGDADWNAYIDVYITRKEKRIFKPCTRRVSMLPIEKLWYEYNDAISKICRKGKLPTSDISRGYDWFSESLMQKTQNQVLIFCRKHANELAVISKCDVDSKRRAIANAFLRFVDHKKGIKLLLRAVRDPDHFAHNMAWQSLLVKLDTFKDSENAFMIPIVLSKAYKLLAHPSTICKNKALEVILYFLENNLLPKKISSRVRILVREAGNFRNPIIHEPARSIIKLCR